MIYIYWLVVSIPLKNTSQLEFLFPIYGKCSKPPTRIYPPSIQEFKPTYLSVREPCNRYCDESIVPTNTYCLLESTPICSGFPDVLFHI